jgi:lysine/ornithine N-monooxygenase
MSSSTTDEIYDLIGLGFGPANIAVSGALTDAWRTKKVWFFSSPLELLIIESSG